MVRTNVLALTYCIIFYLLFDPFARVYGTEITDRYSLQPAQPLTAELSDEINPEVSPDGNWLIYASDKNGNYDLWIRPLSGGIPVALTTHPADDYSPTWDAKGKRLCFVSTRNDPAGDLYQADVSVRGAIPRLRHLKLLLEADGYQNFPTYSADGKVVAYQDDNGTSATIRLFDIKQRRTTVLTGPGFTQPEFSPTERRLLCIHIPEEGAGGQIASIRLPADDEPIIESLYEGVFPAAYPMWSPDGKSFCASLVNEDRNSDGQLDVHDSRALYHFKLDNELWRPRQLTIDFSSVDHPFWANNGYIYFNNIAQGNWDLWRVAEEGEVPAGQSVEEMFAFVDNIKQTATLENRSLTDQEITVILMVYDRVRSAFPDARQESARSMLESARLLQSAGNHQAAQTYLKRIPRTYPEQIEILAEAQIDYQLQVHNAQFQEDGSFTCDNPTSLINNMLGLCDRFADRSESSARARYLAGAAYESIGNIDQALEAYNGIVENRSDAGDYPAEALLRIARIYEGFGSDASALETYLRVVTQHPDKSKPTSKAIEQILKLQLSQAEPIASLQDIIVRYSEVPELAAAAQKLIGDLLAEAGEQELAILEWERLAAYEKRHPTVFIQILAAQSMLDIAAARNKLGEFAAAQLAYQTVEQHYTIDDGHYARQARFNRVVILRKRAESLMQTGDWELALANFEAALQLSSHDVSLHRGRIEAAFYLGRIKEITHDYRRMSADSDNDPVLMYAYGLCLSYSGDTDSQGLVKSTDIIRAALEIKPDLAYGYLTLSYNYETLETLQRGDQNTTRSFLKSLDAAFSNLVRRITFQKKEPPFQGYEKAIQVLQIGLAVNDETNDPALEAKMFLNLGNNYFRLGEFGYARALDAYTEKLKYDSVFVSLEQEAVTLERMGQAATITGKNQIGITSYQKALQAYRKLKKPESEYRIYLRMAELSQVLGDDEQSNSYFSEALRIAEREGFTASPTKWWGNMAYNALQMGDDQEAIGFSDKVLHALPPDSAIPADVVYNPLIIDVLGLPLPIWNFGYLGTGSPASAFGFNQRDERLLSHSVSQEVYQRSRNSPASFDQAAQRLAIIQKRGDPEGEAILWNELGYLYAAQNQNSLARRCFCRSLRLCERHSLRSGLLSALINLATLELMDGSHSSITSDIYLSEIDWFAEYRIGLSEPDWHRIKRVVDDVTTSEAPNDIEAAIKSEFAETTYPEQGIPAIPDMSLIRRLLLLYDQPCGTLKATLEHLEEEIQRFQTDRVGFNQERIKIFELYGKLQLKAAEAYRVAETPDLFSSYQFKGEALWAFNQALGIAQRIKAPDDIIRMQLVLADFYFAEGDFSSCYDYLSSALINATSYGNDLFLWRLYWRIGRLSGCYRPSSSSPLKLFTEHSTYEWFDKAMESWETLPPEQGSLNTPAYEIVESEILYRSALEEALSTSDRDLSFECMQKYSNLKLLQACKGRIFPVKYEKRKYIWGAGGGIIPYLRRQLVDTHREIAAGLNESPVDTLRLQKTEHKLVSIEDEYYSALHEVITEDPEFASLFAMPVFPLDSLKAVLLPGDLLIHNIHGIRQNAWFTATIDTAFFVTGDSSIVKMKLNELLLANHFERIYLAGDYQTSALFSSNPNISEIHYLPDISSLFYLRDKRKLASSTGINLTTNREIEGFVQTPPANKYQYIRMLEEAGIVLIEIDTTHVINPLDHIIFENQDFSVRLSDLFALHSKGNIIIFLSSSTDQTFITEVAFLAGFPNVIFLPSEAPDKLVAAFIEMFREEITTAAPGTAYHTTLRSLRELGYRSIFLDQLKYYGSGGMSLTERQQYAQQHFVETVLKGNYNLQKGDGDWALRYYDEALSMAQTTGDSDAIRNLYLLKIQAGKAINDWEVVLQAQRALIDMAESQNNLQAVEMGYRNLAVYNANKQDFGQAVEALQKARELCIARGDELKYAKDSQVLATYFERLERYDEAEAAIREAQQIYNDWGEYTSYIETGIFQSRLYILQENFYQAKIILDQLEAIVDQFIQEAGESIALPPEYYQYQGLAYEGLTDYTAALECQKEVLNMVSAGANMTSALAHQYLANIYWKMGQYQKAISHLQAARDRFVQLGQSQYVYLAKNTAALIYLSLGDPSRAADEAKDAISGAITANDRKSQSQIEKNLGLIALAQGEVDKAQRRFQKALEIDLELKYTKGQAFAYLDLGNVHLLEQQYDSAEVAFQKALALTDVLYDKRIQVRAEHGLGKAALAQNRTSSALNLLQSAYRTAERYRLQHLIWQIDLALAQAHYQAGSRSDALRRLESAMTIIESMRAEVSAEGLQASFMADKKAIYDLAIQIYIKQDNLALALNTVERSRSRAFLDMLERNRGDTDLGLNPEWTTKEAEIKGELARTQSQVDWLVTRGDARTDEEDALLNSYQAAIDSLKKAYLRLTETIESSRPGFKDMIAVEPRAVTSIQQDLDNRELLVEYYFLPDQLLIFTLSQTKIACESVPVREDSCAYLVNHLRERVERRLNIDAEGSYLYDILFRPIEKYSTKAQHLTVIPVGVLHYLPFALLRDGESRYLLDKFSISTSPSANIYSFCCARAGERQSDRNRYVLGIGSPDTKLPQEDLFFGQKEVESLGFAFENSILFTGSDATESVVRQNSQHASIVHFACHGEFDHERPVFSTLFLAPSGGDDGHLNMLEILNLRLDDCSLVTLSACESGLGSIAGGDEIIGFSRALIYAGTPRVIASLWKVDDLATAVMVKHFYRYLQRGESAAEALRQAQLHVRSRINTHPSYWAAFVLTGAPGSIGISDRNN